MRATPRWPYFKWMLLFRRAEAVYPAKGERKMRDMTTKVKW
jgi:hypothetical protein